MRPVLQSWKEISAYVGRTERTLQRWERAFGFPVHRPAGRSRSAVVALVDEIQKWTLDRPSLADIRTVRRIKPEKLSEPAPARKPKVRNGHLEAQVTAPVSNDVRAFQNQPSLQAEIDRQRSLCADVRDLVMRHRTLCEDLRQTMMQSRAK